MTILKKPEPRDVTVFRLYTTYFADDPREEVVLQEFGWSAMLFERGDSVKVTSGVEMELDLVSMNAADNLSAYPSLRHIAHGVPSYTVRNLAKPITQIARDYSYELAPLGPLELLKFGKRLQKELLARPLVLPPQLQSRPIPKLAVVVYQ